ncbi:hypothetical protein RF11_12939 [Thelohanellus kitauei]|uniref:Uncharacterized protein n=1 Tax=Thelohanellus kitauei TaxID=669202 RepID=A0A0C2MSV1_THEKT|nr:hypothetical protein RF11_12939 [Thelohanellus kitauei]
MSPQLTVSPYMPRDKHVYGVHNQVMDSKALTVTITAVNFHKYTINSGKVYNRGTCADIRSKLTEACGNEADMLVAVIWSVSLFGDERNGKSLLLSSLSHNFGFLMEIVPNDVRHQPAPRTNAVTSKLHTVADDIFRPLSNSDNSLDDSLAINTDV